MGSKQQQVFAASPMPFHGDRFFGSQTVQLMSPAAWGVYVRLLWLAWRDGSVPSDPEKLAKLVPMAFELFMAVWPELRECWLEQDGRLFQRHLDDVRADLEAHRARQRAAAKSRWHAGGISQSDAGGIDPAYAEPMPSGIAPKPIQPKEDRSTPQPPNGESSPHPEGGGSAVSGGGGTGDGRDGRVRAQAPLREGIGLLLDVGYRSGSPTQTAACLTALRRFEGEGGDLADLQRLVARARKKGRDPGAMMAVWLDRGTWRGEVAKRR